MTVHVAYVLECTIIYSNPLAIICTTKYTTMLLISYISELN
jgi:hypothetical protein